MKANEFYEKYEGKYFTYDGKKVRVVGFERYSDLIIVTGYGDKSSFIKNSLSWISNEYASISDVFHRCSIYEKPFYQFIDSVEAEIQPCIESSEPISKRFYAACCAMQGILSTEYSKDIPNDKIIKMSYLLADELLKRENDGKALQ